MDCAESLRLERRWLRGTTQVPGTETCVRTPERLGGQVGDDSPLRRAEFVELDAVAHVLAERTRGGEEAERHDWQHARRVVDRDAELA